MIALSFKHWLDRRLRPSRSPPNLRVHTGGHPCCTSQSPPRSSPPSAQPTARRSRASRGKLSVEEHHHHRAGDTRWRNRPRRPPDGRQDVEGLGQAGRDRQQGRRYRHHRDAGRGDRRARRPHAGAGGEQPRDQPDDVQEAAVRHGEELRAGGADARGAARAGRQSEAAGQQREGAHRLRQGQPGQAHRSPRAATAARRTCPASSSRAWPAST